MKCSIMSIDENETSCEKNGIESGIIAMNVNIHPSECINVNVDCNLFQSEDQNTDYQEEQSAHEFPNKKRKGSLFGRSRKKNKRKKVATPFKTFNCHLCKHKFKSWTALSNHCKDYHNSKPQITCSCGKTLHTRRMLRDHQAEHLGNIFECATCKKVFYSKTTLTQHMICHLPKEQQPYICSKCGRHFHAEALLKHHERVHLPKEEKLIYPCHLCRKMFSTNAAVSAHLRAIHLGEKPYVCDQCGRAFAAKGMLEQHLTIHSDLAPWKCTDCSKSFKTKYRLKIHMDIHRDTRYQCPNCPTQLNTKRTLRNHLLIHGDMKAYQCAICGKSFRRSKDLKNHTTLHTGQRPYTCPFCYRTFANGSNCRAHKRRMHPEELEAYDKSLLENASHSLLDVCNPNSTMDNKEISLDPPSTPSGSLNETIKYLYSNGDENHESLVNSHSIFSNSLYINNSEGLISDIPAFPGNSYV